MCELRVVLTHFVDPFATGRLQATLAVNRAATAVVLTLRTGSAVGHLRVCATPCGALQTVIHVPSPYTAETPEEDHARA